MTVKIKLREGAAQRVRRRLGCDSDNQVAHRLGVAPSTWTRAARGVTSPGPKLSSRLLALGFSPTTLFEVVAEPAELAGTATAVTGQESLQLAELASINAAYTAVDAATATDTGFLAPDLTLGELVTLGEAALIQLTSADQATVGEAQSADEYIGPYTSDTGRLTARVDIAATLTAQDTLSLVDEGWVAVLRFGVDTAHATDSSLLAVAVADTATLTVAPAVAGAITAGETILLEDVYQLTQPVLTSDTAVLGELAAIRDLGRDITAAGPPYIRWRASTPYT